jgi:hypothetical protein
VQERAGNVSGEYSPQRTQGTQRLMFEQLAGLLIIGHKNAHKSQKKRI